MRGIILAGLAIVFFGNLNAQNFRVINGKVVDEVSGKPIGFANIHLKSGTSGTSANVNGEFIFKFSENLVDTVVFSSIGYKPAEIPLAKIRSNITVELNPASVQLQEVVVRGESAFEFFNRAMDSIPSTYDTTKYHMTGFFREHTHLADFDLTYSEAVLDVFKTYKGGELFSDQIKVVKGRKKNFDYSSDFHLYIWIGNLSNTARSIFSDDYLKYRFAKNNPFNPANYRFYDFAYGQVIDDGERKLVEVIIQPKQKSRKGYLVINVFIDERSMAVAKLNYDLTKKGVRMVERKDKGIGYTIMSAAILTSLDYNVFRGSVNFIEHNDKWYIGSISKHYEILVSSRKRKMKDRPWIADFSFNTTDIDLANKEPISQGDIGKNRGSFKSFIDDKADSSFWENYNIVKPVFTDTVRKFVPLADTVANGSKDFKKGFFESKEKTSFTHADTLRGKLSPMRSAYDVKFYHLDVDVDLKSRSLGGSNLIRFTATEDFKKMQIDLYANMTIDKIIYRSKPLLYTREADAVFIEFPDVIQRNSQHEITVFYHGVPQVPDFSVPMKGGVLWEKDSLGNDWVQVVCQGSGASLWWPNKDHLSDEPDSVKIWITVPSEFDEISNGRLIRKNPVGNKKVRYEWFVSYPINNYNVTFSIGKYSTISDTYISDDTLDLTYNVLRYNAERAKKFFLQVKPMLKTFEKYFGKYAFRNDGFTLVESIHPMEHQSGVCIGKLSGNLLQNETSPLLWHESAHEWWGNAISCTDLADMWFHEAFATYAESLVIEDQHGKELATRFLNDQRDAVGNKRPIIGHYDVNDIFYDINDMYGKGSLVIMTLRSVINDDKVFFDLLRGIQENFRYRTLTSNEFEKFVSQKLQKDLSPFFDQYLRHATLPVLEAKLKETKSGLEVQYRWKAEVKDFNIPVRVTTAPDKFDFMYPSSEWKTMKLAGITAGEFDVDDENFLIEAEIE